MQLKPHLIDQWLQEHGQGVEFDLGSSTGPHWSVRELLALDGDGALERLLDTKLVYARTAGTPPLRAAVAEMHGVPASHVLVLAGAAEALVHLFWIAAEPGANVVVPFPCFPPHRTIPESLGLEVRSYQLRRENAYRIDLDEVRRLVDARTKILLVNLPNNPTGAALSGAEMHALHNLAVERGVQFVCDEVHHPVYHGPGTASAARLPSATSIGDFSKAFSLPGLRLGWVVEPDARRREQVLNAREYTTISNTPMAETLAEIAVKHRDLIWGRVRRVAGANLERLDALMARHAEALAWVRPQGGMTAFPWFVSGADAREFCTAAARRGLLLAPGDCFGAADHFRLGFGVSATWFPAALARFAELLEDWAHRPAARRVGA